MPVAALLSIESMRIHMQIFAAPLAHINQIILIKCIIDGWIIVIFLPNEPHMKCVRSFLSMMTGPIIINWREWTRTSDQVSERLHHFHRFIKKKRCEIWTHTRNHANIHAQRLLFYLIYYNIFRLNIVVTNKNSQKYNGWIGDVWNSLHTKR